MSEQYATQKNKGSDTASRILAAIASVPRTKDEIRAITGFAASTIALHLNRMNKAPRQAYVTRFKRRSVGRPQSWWLAGDKPNAEFVPLILPGKKGRPDRAQQIMALLAEQPMTMREVSARTHTVYQTASRWLTRLRRKKLIYIADWRHPSKFNLNGTGGEWAPVYAIGNKKEAKKPPRETSAQRHARLYAQPEYRNKRLQQQRINYRIKLAKAKPQGIFAALGL